MLGLDFDKLVVDCKENIWIQIYGKQPSSPNGNYEVRLLLIKKIKRGLEQRIGWSSGRFPTFGSSSTYPDIHTICQSLDLNLQTIWYQLGYMGFTYVNSQFRRRGYGTELVKALENSFKRQGAGYVCASVGADGKLLLLNLGYHVLGNTAFKKL